MLRHSVASWVTTQAGAQHNGLSTFFHSLLWYKQCKSRRCWEVKLFPREVFQRYFHNTLRSCGFSQHSCFQPKVNQHEMYHKKTLIWCRSLYISVKLANNTMHGCAFVTYIYTFKHIMFTVQADHQGTSTTFHFHVHCDK